MYENEQLIRHATPARQGKITKFARVFVSYADCLIAFWMRMKNSNIRASEKGNAQSRALFNAALNCTFEKRRKSQLKEKKNGKKSKSNE